MGFLPLDMLHKTGYNTCSHHQCRSYNQFYVKYSRSCAPYFQRFSYSWRSLHSTKR